MKKHGKAGKAGKRTGRSSARSAKMARKVSKRGVSRGWVPKRRAVPRRQAKSKQAKRLVRARPAAVKPKQPEARIPPSHKAADEVPTLEQVTITCANCGRPFKVFKLKGLSLEGTICQRCSVGEMELPESFG